MAFPVPKACVQDAALSVLLRGLCEVSKGRGADFPKLRVAAKPGPFALPVPHVASLSSSLPVMSVYCSSRAQKGELAFCGALRLGDSGRP